MLRVNCDNQKLCRKIILCPECPFKLDFHGNHKKKSCYKGLFRGKR
jgi:hypothetical protein